MAARLQLDKRRLSRDFGYEPHEGQLRVHLSRAKRRVLTCGIWRIGDPRSWNWATDVFVKAPYPRAACTTWGLGRRC